MQLVLGEKKIYRIPHGLGGFSDGSDIRELECKHSIKISGDGAGDRYETVKAGDAVAALKASLKPMATCKRDGQWKNMDATLLVPGDLVLLAAGSAVPADCIVRS